ncbi:MAG TPA: TolC family protein [Muribaculum sp.]|uniref:TolC family protein n=1 Tax=Heminiphilus faecis TaxID=2601703 RepID=A0ABV4CUE9_9BACT|nr:TolC family protein [Heminiphilus faecis]RLT76892.1 hypothetical protein D7V95_06035 [bacterium J10(2018)]HRF67725.1 TolC family protein [Muribaculum sp.]
MYKSISIFFILTLIAAWNAEARDFNGLLDTVLGNNMALSSSQASNENELLQLKSENNLADPEVEVEHLWGRHDAKNKFNISVSQSFDWPGTYAARSKAINFGSQAIESLNRSNYLDKKLEIKLLFIDIINTRKKLALLHERDKQTDSLIAICRTGVENGEQSILTLNKLEITKIRFKNSLVNLENQYTALKTSLIQMNGGLDCEEILAHLDEYPDEMILSVDEYENQILEKDPMKRYSALMVQSQLQNVKAEKLKRFPGISLGYVHAREDGEIFNGISAGISLPVFSTRHKIKAAEALQRSLKYDEATQAISQRTSMMASRDKALALYKEYKALDAILKNGNNQALLKKSLDNGIITAQEYLNEMSYFLDAWQDLLDAQYNYHLEAAVLNKYMLLDE